MSRLTRGLILGSFVGFAAVAIPVALHNPASAGAPESSPTGPSGATTENADLTEYQDAYGVTAEQARAEWELTDLAGELQASLVKTTPEVFGGLWVDHEPAFEIVVNVVHGGEALVQQQIELLGLAAVTRVQETQFTYVQLLSDQALLNDIAPPGIEFASGIMPSIGGVVLSVASDEDAAAFQAVSLPESISIVVEPLGGETVAIYGA